MLSQGSIPELPNRHQTIPRAILGRVSRTFVCLDANAALPGDWAVIQKMHF